MYKLCGEAQHGQPCVFFLCCTGTVALIALKSVVNNIQYTRSVVYYFCAVHHHSRHRSHQQNFATVVEGINEIKQPCKNILYTVKYFASVKVFPL